MNQNYDVIIIGSGIGALSAASILAQLKDKRVLILERHFKIGGFTHIFKRQGKYEWDVGLHYIGEMHKGSLSRMLFDYVTQGNVSWNPMPDVYDRFVYPDFSFDAVKGKQNFKNALIKKFPDEENAINQYFLDLKRVSKWTHKYFLSKTFPKYLSFAAKRMTASDKDLALMITGEYLQQQFKNPKLRAVLVSQWGDYGLPPSQSAFVIHAIVSGHYFNGGYYPVESSKSIADSIIPIIKGKGGDALINNVVENIIVKNGKAIGVKVKEKKGNNYNEIEYYAKNIISNAGLHTTLNKLLPENYSHLKESIEQFESPTTSLVLYIGFKVNPKQLGFNGENYWIYTGYNHDEIFLNSNEIIDGKVNMVYLSFPSLKNPNASHHTAEIITMANYDLFKKWEDNEWKNRGTDYEQLKEKIGQSLINFVNDKFPGFKDIIDYYELSTPLSNRFFTGHKTGAIYGIPATPERYNLELINWRTPVRNLYLAGADTPAGHGIVGSLMGGIAAAGVIMGIPFGLKNIVNASKKFSKSLR